MHLPISANLTHHRWALRWADRLSSRWATALLFGALLLAALIARLLTFDQYLPYLDNQHRETNMFLLALDWRGVGANSLYGISVTLTGDWLEGYPPLFVWLNMGVQVALERFASKPWLLINDYIYAMRLLAVVYGVVTTGLIAYSGGVLGGRLAGTAAGMVWALSPVVLAHNSMAIPDPLVFLLCAASIALALRAWKKDSPRWLVGSLLAAVLAIYAKYTVAPILLPCGLATLWMTAKQPRRMLPWVAALALIAIVGGGYLIFGYRAFELSNDEADDFRDSGLRLMFDLARNIHNLQFVLLPLGVPAFVGVALAAAAAYGYSARQGWRRVPLPWIGILAVYSAASLLVLSGFILLEADAMRHALPVTVALVTLWGIGLAQIYWTLRDWTTQHHDSRAATALTIAPAMLCLAVCAFLVVGTGQLARQFSQPHAVSLLWRYADDNLPEDGVIITSNDSLLRYAWNRPYSGYDGFKTWEWAYDSAPENNTPEELAARGVAYLMFTDEDWQTDYCSPRMNAFIEQIAFVKTIAGAEDPNIAGPNIHIYRIAPPQHDADFTYGGQIQFVGYDLSAARVEPGGRLVFRPYWRSAQTPTADYTLFVHVYPADRVEIVTQMDTPPTTARRPTHTWTDPDELYIGSDVELILLDETLPGQYRLAVGLYNSKTGERLTAPDGSDFFAIPIEVVD